MTGSEFRKIRRDMDLTQAQLAEKLGLSTGTIVAIEKSSVVQKGYAMALLHIRDHIIWKPIIGAPRDGTIIGIMFDNDINSTLIRVKWFNNGWAYINQDDSVMKLVDTKSITHYCDTPHFN